MILSCPLCGGKYSGVHSHSHTIADVFDSRFSDCGICRGYGAITCEMCEGCGRIEQTPDGIKPAREFAQEQKERIESFARNEITANELKKSGQPEALKQFVDKTRPEWAREWLKK